jgi:hypothetical protein
MDDRHVGEVPSNRDRPATIRLVVYIGYYASTPIDPETRERLVAAEDRG